MCRACPVQVACLTFALDNPDQTVDGIWGGMTPRERARARKVQTTERTAA
ncbi:WhiB family transcriptional regulator [Nonomuraea sp. NPDC004297]